VSVVMLSCIRPFILCHSTSDYACSAF
jgi:hypothetical protein